MATRVKKKSAAVAESSFMEAIEVLGKEKGIASEVLFDAILSLIHI